MSDTSTKQHRNNEYNIFCSEMVQVLSIQKELKHVVDNNDICKLEIEDLLCCVGKSHYRKVLPHVRHTLLAIASSRIYSSDRGRDWQYVRFLDSFSSDLYCLWKKRRDGIMRDCEALFDDDLRNDVLQWRATIKVMAGSTGKDIIHLLKTIKKDQYMIDCCILDGMTYENASPEAITEHMKWTSNNGGRLTRTFVLKVRCGWSECSRQPIEYLLGSLIAVLLNKKPGQEPPAAVVTRRAPVMIIDPSSCRQDHHCSSHLLSPLKPTCLDDHHHTIPIIQGYYQNSNFQQHPSSSSLTAHHHDSDFRTSEELLQSSQNHTNSSSDFLERHGNFHPSTMCDPSTVPQKAAKKKKKKKNGSSRAHQKESQLQPLLPTDQPTSQVPPTTTSSVGSTTSSDRTLRKRTIAKQQVQNTNDVATSCAPAAAVLDVIKNPQVRALLLTAIQLTAPNNNDNDLNNISRIAHQQQHDNNQSPRISSLARIPTTTRQRKRIEQPHPRRRRQAMIPQ